jgi:hypothetical protein
MYGVSPELMLGLAGKNSTADFRALSLLFSWTK